MSTALYRRYRPETFTDVIGQEHVTEPLMAALTADRVTHAYLFSGPRGCGKTTSARILARCLNCAQGPTAEPCGQCDSCVELARGGPGSLDVVEIDAASHNGVDDARELRERAAFAPARDRYKIFILDEAHMVTTQGFNALLKLVEEPPPHIKFVFATTEPDKVIGTIRSRTHHYPFRLVAPEKLTDYLQSLARAEGISVAGGVLPLVVRAGGGSVRDSLSVLDQLIAGAQDAELTYERAVALLGFTHATLLDDAVEALAARDGLSVFRVVDRVIESGHAPRRFVEDLLERLRDLIVVRAAGDEAASVLRSVPADQLERMRAQAQHMGAGALSRAADLVNEGLTEMTGATSPRLQLELLCARLLLPAADDGVDGFGARLDRLEAAIASASAPGGPAAAARPTTTPAPQPQAREAPASRGGATERPAEAAARTQERPRPADPEPAPRPAEPEPAPDSGSASDAGPPAPAAAPDEPAGSVTPAAPVDARAPAAVESGGPMTTDQVRRRWPEVLDTLARLKRTSWALVSQDAQVMDLSPTTLSLGFSTSGLATAFRSGPHADMVAQALRETLGVEVRIEPVLNDGSGGGGGSVPDRPVPGQSRPDARAADHTAESAPSARGEQAYRPAPVGQPEARLAEQPAQPVQPARRDPGAASGGEEPEGTGAGQGHSSAPPHDSGRSGPGATGEARAAGTASAEVRGPRDSPASGAAPERGGDGWADVPVRRPPQSPSAGANESPGSGSDSGRVGAPGHDASSRAGAGPDEAGAPGAPAVDGISDRSAQHSSAQGAPAQSAPAQSAPAQDAPAHGASGYRAIATQAQEAALVAEPPRNPHASAPVQRLGDEADEHSDDDPALETTEVVGAPLVARLLGGTVIDEEIDDPGQVR